MQINGHDIAVCSWSLQPRSIEDLLDRVRLLQLSHVQLALAPLITMDDDARKRAIATLRDSMLQFTGGMISFDGEDYSSIDSIRRTGGFVPDDLWPARRQRVAAAARVARELKLPSVTTHIGFVPSSSRAEHRLMADRVREAAEMLAASDVRLLLETGQEPAHELREFLEELHSPTVGINFDPANMILYGAGDPITAVGALGQRIGHVHIKDAVASREPGQQWGDEVPFGTGQVDPRRFLNALKATGYDGPLAIEREAGTQRLADVRTAVAALRQAAS